MTNEHDERDDIEVLESLLDNVSPAEKHREALYDLAQCVRQSNGGQAADLFAVEMCGLPATNWAEVTDRDRSTVSRNVRRATD